MQVILHPKQSGWPNFLKRPYVDNAAVLHAAQNILDDVKAGGDTALRSLSRRFDGVDLAELQVQEQEIAAAEKAVPGDLKAAIQHAKQNIETFHKAQYTEPEKIETAPGVFCWRKSIAIEKVGLYIPGGTAPLFSTVLMLGVPAQLAGCREIILCSPLDKDGNI